MIYFISYAFLLVVIEFEVHGISVTVPVGTLNGKVVVTRENFTYYSFQKVPFAEPPVGNLRFQAPLPKHNSTDNFNNTKIDYMCYQIKPGKLLSFFDARQTEDCLYLNIYTPQLPDAQTNNTLLPVLVFYHGGGFFQGFTSEKSFGPDFLIQENILVVTVNYRIGPFGFMSTGDTVIPGNAGLKDQLLGLKWVKDNIHHFGGDPSKITIGGESAGGASAVLLMLNEKAKGLFRGVIAHSGSALHNWSYQRHPRRIAFELAQKIDKNFTSNSSENLRDFLLRVEPEQITQAGETAVVLGICEFREIESFAPVAEVDHEDAFLTEANRYELMESGNVARVPILTGFASEEASILVINHLEEQVSYFQDLDEHIENLTVLITELNKSDLNASKEVGKKIRDIYVDGELSENIAQGIRLCSDLLLTNAVIKTAELLLKWSDVFLYQFSYYGNITRSRAPIFPPGVEKVSHCDEHHYLWRVIREKYDTADYSTISEDEIKTHERLVKMWSNFIKYLNPTPRMEENPEVLWPSARSRGNETLLYMNINTTLEVRENPKDDTYRLWNMVYEEYAEKPYTTF